MFTNLRMKMKSDILTHLVHLAHRLHTPRSRTPSTDGAANNRVVFDVTSTTRSARLSAHVGYRIPASGRALVRRPYTHDGELAKPQG